MKKIIYIALMAAAAMFAGCKETPVVLPTGLSLSLSADVTFVDKVVKSESAIDVNTFIVTIEKKDGSVSRTWTYGQLPSLVELSPGTYTVNVNSPVETEIGWDCPAYGGTKDFEIVEGVVTPIEIICTLQNMKSSVYCSQHLVNELTTFEVKISNEDGYLVWTADEVGIYADEDGVKTIVREPLKHAYFTVAQLSVDVDGYREVDNSSATLTYEIKNVAARDHHILFVDAYVTGQSQMALSIDTSVNDHFVNVVMPGIDPEDSDVQDDIEAGWGQPEEEPDQPGIEQPAAPSLEWPANPDFVKLDIAQGMNVELKVYAPAMIKEFIVRVSDNFLPAIQMLVPGIEYLDLINHQPTIEALGTMLPVGDQLYGQTEVEFSLSKLVPLIASVGNLGEDYIFTLEVTDELDQTLVKDVPFYNPAI